MNNFSSFPVFYWAAKQAAQTAIIWQKEEKALAAFSDFPENISWQQFADWIAKFAQNLPACSHIIAYSGTHKLLGLLCYCAVIAANKQILGLNPALTDSQRKQILADNHVDLCLTDHDCLAYLQTDEASFAFAEMQYHRPATLTLTSGSSGKPKAVVHCLKNHLDNAQGVCELMQFQPTDQWLLSLPLFHVSGQGIVWRWLLKGATLRICGNKQRFWQQLAQCSHASLVPTQLQRYLQNLPKNRPLAQHILLGGANIPAKLLTQAQAVGITTYASYGMTEMASTICAAKNSTKGVGEPLMGREVSIVQDEIWVRGAGLGLGYWLNGKIQSFTNAEGWLQTKDKGQWQNTQLHICGRLDNLFISGGENIQPEEIEQVLWRSALLKNVIVVPVNETEFGQRPVALVELVDDFSLQAVQTLQNFAKAHLERFKQPIAYFPLNTQHWQQNSLKLPRLLLTQYAQQLFNEKCNEI